MEFPSLSAPLDALPLQDARTQVENDIARSLSILSRLRCRMNSLADISRHFPEEILAEIFIQYRSIFEEETAGDTVNTSRFYAFIRIAHVSHHWRHVALSCPRLWACIYIQNNLEFTEELLCRSKESALTVEARFVNERRIPSLNRVLQEMHRIRSLNIITDPKRHSSAIVGLFGTSSPLLENISITFNTRYGDPPTSSPGTPDSIMPMPRLWSLILRNISISQAALFMCKTIRHLTLRGRGQLVESNPQLDRMDRKRLMESLASLPFLATLDMERLLSPQADTTQPSSNVHLPRLESLRIVESPANMIWMLSCLRLSESCTLSLGHLNPASPIHQFSLLATEISLKLGGGQSESPATLLDLSINRVPTTRRISLHGWSKSHPISPASNATPHFRVEFCYTLELIPEILQTLLQELPLQHLRSLYVGDIDQKDSILSMTNSPMLKVLFLHKWDVKHIANLLLQQTSSETPASSTTGHDTICPPAKIIFPSLDLLVLRKAQFEDDTRVGVEPAGVGSREVESGGQSSTPDSRTRPLLEALKARQQWGVGIRQVDLKGCWNLEPSSVQDLTTVVTGMGCDDRSLE